MTLIQARMSREIGVFSPKDPRQKQYGIPGGRRILLSARHRNPQPAFACHLHHKLSPRRVAYHRRPPSFPSECSLRLCHRPADEAPALVARSLLLVNTSG